MITLFGVYCILCCRQSGATTAKTQWWPAVSLYQGYNCSRLPQTNDWESIWWWGLRLNSSRQNTFLSLNLYHLRDRTLSKRPKPDPALEEYYCFHAFLSGGQTRDRIVHGCQITNFRSSESNRVCFLHTMVMESSLVMWQAGEKCMVWGLLGPTVNLCHT